MTNIVKDYPLASINTFHVQVKSQLFAEITTEAELQELLKSDIIQAGTTPILVLGGGSNVLFTQDFPGIVIKNSLRGITVVSETDTDVLVKAAAGENWHNFVMKCVDNGWGGVENLALVPGSVGASPMQNIGAYGVEIKNTFHELEAMEIKTGERRIFQKEECKFGYRDSIFKNVAKDKYIITSVTLKLSKNPVLNTSYGAVSAELEQMGVSNPTLKDVANAVINIRRSKLPDPAEIGTAGSFFKNPIVSQEKYLALKANYPEIPSFPDENNPEAIKIPAGWLIENAGWKGYLSDDKKFGVYPKHALVLVNYADAKGTEIYQLALTIQKSVVEKFGVTLEPEVNIY